MEGVIILKHFPKNNGTFLIKRYCRDLLNLNDEFPIFKITVTVRKILLTAIRDVRITSQWLWNCPFRGHLIITPSLVGEPKSFNALLISWFRAWFRAGTKTGAGAGAGAGAIAKAKAGAGLWKNISWCHRVQGTVSLMVTAKSSRRRHFFSMTSGVVIIVI